MAYVRNWLEQADSNISDSLERNVNPAIESVEGAVGAVESELNDVSNLLNNFNRNMPHYRNSQAGVYNWEPVYLNQFDVILTPPAAITGTGYFSDLLIEQVKSISGIPTMLPVETVEQKYMWATRTFSKPVPTTTTAELEMKFEININNRGSMYAYELLKEWSDLSFNYGNGFHGLKRQYAGHITVLVHNKLRKVFRQVDFMPVYMFDSMTQMELEYLSEDIYVLTAKFKADAWKEKRIQLGKSVLT